MNRFSSIFGQILQIFSRAEFYRAVIETGAEKGAKEFSCWQQFVAMLYCQLGKVKEKKASFWELLFPNLSTKTIGGLANLFGEPYPP